MSRIPATTGRLFSRTAVLRNPDVSARQWCSMAGMAIPASKPVVASQTLPQPPRHNARQIHPHPHPRTHAHCSTRPVASTTPRRPAGSAAYHTYQSKLHPTPYPPYDRLPPHPPAAQSILDAALPYVNETGFTLATLRRGAREAGYVDAAVQLFANERGGGQMALVEWFLMTKRGELQRMVEGGEVWDREAGARLGVEEKVRMLVWERLRLNLGVREKWQEGLAILSIPTNAPTALHELYALASDILYLAGDKSLDFSWYTKRLWVGSVYAATDVAMTEDASQDLRPTREFLDRAAAAATGVGEVLGGAKRWVDFKGFSLAGLLRSKGMRI